MPFAASAAVAAVAGGAGEVQVRRTPLAGTASVRVGGSTAR